MLLSQAEIGQQLLAEVRKHQQQLAGRLRNEGQMEFDFIKELDEQTNTSTFMFDDYTDDKVPGLVSFQDV
jgi:hypothetical protein